MDDHFDKYTYSGNKITIKNDEEEFIFVLENGRIKSYSCIYNDGNENATLKYDGNYLCKVNTIGKDEEDGEEWSFTETFSFSNGNLSKYEYNDDDDWENAVFTYGNQLNNLNIDLFYFLDCLESEIVSAFQFDMTGKRSKYLPVNIKFSYPEYDDDDNIIGTDTYTINLTYEMDGEYITKIILKDEDGDTEIYKIEYE